MKSARRRTGTYFHSEARASEPTNVRAPQDTGPKAVQSERIQDPVLRIRQSVIQRLHAPQAGFRARRSFPDSSGPVGSGVEAGDNPRIREGAKAVVLQRVGGPDAGEIGRGIAVSQACGCGLLQPIARRFQGADGGRQIQDDEGPPLLGIRDGGR